MGFKSRIFGETLILCALMMLDIRNIVNGCKLLRPDGGEVNLNEPGNILAGIGEIRDDEPPGLLYTFTIEGIAFDDPDPPQESKYLVYSANDTTLNIFLSENYENWKKIEDETFTIVSVLLKQNCTSNLVEFRAQISSFTNMYPPKFPDSSYSITLPMPLPVDYTIFGECGENIEVTDYDYHSNYRSNVNFSLKDTTEDLNVTASKLDGKKWAVILKTTNTLRIKEPLTVTVVAEDVPPEGKNDSRLSSEMTIIIEPDVDASTPESPLFDEPIYILDIRGEEDIEPITVILEEGATSDYEVELIWKHGENLEKFFDIETNEEVVTLIPDKSLASTEFSNNFGVLILEASHPGTNRIGKTVIHVTLPENYVTPPPTSATETTMLPCTCPTEETTYTADTTKPTEEITQCPEVTSQTEVTSPDVTTPDVTCPLVTCPEVTGTDVTCSDATSPEVTATDVTCPVVTCPDVTCPEVTGTDITYPDVTSATEPTILPCTCATEETTLISDTTKPTEKSTYNTDETEPTEKSTYNTDETEPTKEGTQCPEVTSPTEVTCPVVTCAPATTVQSCTCPPIEEPPTTSPSTSDTGNTTTTTTVKTPTCEPCECTPGTPESSAAPPLEKIIYFTDPQAVVYIYAQQMGYIKTMSASCIPGIPVCKIKYEIVAGPPLSSSLIIDPETGDINITAKIKESGLFDVKAIAKIDGIDYEETATVHLSVMTLQPCQSGSYWTNTLTVKHIQEELESPYIVEKCDFMDGCECAIVKVIPEKAREYFIDGREVVLAKKIDREDTELFPDQSNTYIILHLELSCESNETTIYKFWDKRSRSTIDDIGNIEYDELRTVTLIQIEDINDNRPKFDITSLTVGYPSAEIAHQLLPPYLVNVQATDADFGENAIIKYSLMPDDQFLIHQDTGVIYPVAEAFIYKDTQFQVYASDSEGAGDPLEVNVTILSSDNLLVIKQKGSVLEDVNAVIDQISSITTYNIKLLSAAVIASDTVVNDAVNEMDDRQLPDFKSMNESSNSLLQLIIYGLDFEEKPVPYSDIQEKLGETTDFTSETWTPNNTTNESSDTSLLTVVIVLAVLIVLLLVGAGVAYKLYFRPRMNKDNDYLYDRMLNNSEKSSISEGDTNLATLGVKEESDFANEQLSNKTEVIQPSATLSPHLSTTKPEQEVVNMIEPNEFNQETTDVKNTASDGEDGEHQDEKMSENTVKRRKSMVTFNENVEEIDIEEV